MVTTGTGAGGARWPPAPSGQRLGMLPASYNAQDGPQQRGPEISVLRLENPELIVLSQL